MGTSNIENPEALSEEIQEIIGRTPGWMNRFGIGIILLLFMISAGLSALIKYPDMVKTKLAINKSAGLAIVYSNVFSTIKQLPVKNGKQVKIGDTLAVLQQMQNITVITAPIAGSVFLKGFFHPGQPVAKGDQLFFIVDGKEWVYGEAAVTVHDLSKIKKGQKVWVQVPENADRIEAELCDIAVIPDATGIYLTEVRIHTKGLPLLLPGRRYEAEIQVAEVSLYSKITGSMKLFPSLK